MQQEQLEEALRESEVEHARAMEVAAREEIDLHKALDASMPEVVPEPEPEAAPEPKPPPPPPSPKPLAKSVAECVVCLEAKMTHIVVPCGHYCLCEECAWGLTLCPMCRAPIKQTLRVFNHSE